MQAKHDRNLEQRGAKLFAKLAGGPPDGQIEVEIAGLTERPKASRKAARAARQKRRAACELRYRRVRLPATRKGAEQVELAGVHVVESAAPEGEQPVQWYLLTSLPVGDAEVSAEIVRLYLQRWRVEDFFRLLKVRLPGGTVRISRSGPAAASDRDQHRDRVAHHADDAAGAGGAGVRGGPDVQRQHHELGFLADYAVKFGLGGPANLGAAVQLVAHLGGYRNRKHDPDPGHQIMWHGYSALTNATLGHQVAMESVHRRALEGQP